MARIRTVKPEFWTDQKTGTLSDVAKLLFLGLLNLADDCGVLRFTPDELRVKIFPYDSRSTTVVVLYPLMEELVVKGLVEAFGYSPDDDGPMNQYLLITNFCRHQVINKRSKPLLIGWEPSDTTSTYASRRGINLQEFSVTVPSVDSIPLPEDSGSATGALPGGRERKGKEGNGVSVPSGPHPPDGGMHDQKPGIVGTWNSLAKEIGCPQVSAVSKKRKQKLKARLNEKEFIWPAILTAAREAKGAHGKAWFTFDFIIENDTNYLKLLEGKYRQEMGVRTLPAPPEFGDELPELQ